MKHQTNNVTEKAPITRKKTESTFDTILEEFMENWGRFSEIKMIGELYDTKFSFNYTQYGKCMTLDLACNKVIDFEKRLIESFDRNVKQKEKKFMNKVKYDFGFLTGFIPECMIKLEVSRLKVENQAITIILGSKDNLKGFVYEKEWYHKKISIKIEPSKFEELENEFKTQKEKIIIEPYFPLPVDIFKANYKLYQVKLAMLSNVYLHVTSYYQKMRRHLIARMDKPLFTINEPEPLSMILLSLLGSNIINLTETNVVFDEMNFKERQQSFRQLLFNLNLKDTLISDLMEKISQNKRYITSLFNRLEKKFPISTTRK